MSPVTDMASESVLPRLKAILEPIDSGLRLAVYGRAGSKYTFAKGLHEGMARNLLELADMACALPDSLKEQCAGIPWAKLAGLRRGMLYDRYRLNPERLWATAETELPLIRAEIEAMIAALGQNSENDQSSSQHADMEDTSA